MKRFLLTFCAALVVLPLSGNTLPSAQRKNNKLVQAALESVRLYLQKSSAVFYDSKSHTNFIYGTVISKDGLILTKASELEEVEKFSVRIDDKNYRNPQILAASDTWDLALVKVKATNLTPVTWASSSDLSHGTWVVSNGATKRKYRRPRAGIISANKREIPGGAPAVLGVGLKDTEDGIEVTQVTKKSGAAESGVQKGDVILKIEGKELKKREELVELLKEKSAGDMLAIEIRRKEEILTMEVELMARHKLYGGVQSRNDSMSGEFSPRRTGFPMVLQHETMLSRRSVGGPLLNFEGQCVGMNIAMANRVESYAIPVENLREEIPKLKEQAEEEEQSP